MTLGIAFVVVLLIAVAVGVARVVRGRRLRAGGGFIRCRPITAPMR